MPKQDVPDTDSSSEDLKKVKSSGQQRFRWAEMTELVLLREVVANCPIQTAFGNHNKAWEEVSVKVNVVIQV